ncbi:hypothetical protein AC233_06555 [Burkholderia sp. HB1]|nr:hypothetical protein AC233_06555 [Burkholderia sp. HB1]
MAHQRFVHAVALKCKASRRLLFRRLPRPLRPVRVLPSGRECRFKSKLPAWPLDAPRPTSEWIVVFSRPAQNAACGNSTRQKHLTAQR